MSKIQSRKPVLNQLPTSQSGTPAPSVEPPAERCTARNPMWREATCFKPGQRPGPRSVRAMSSTTARTPGERGQAVRTCTPGASLSGVVKVLTAPPAR